MPSSEKLIVRRSSAGASSSESLIETDQANQLSACFAESLSCVLYECAASLELTYISENVSELLGIEPSELLGTKLLSDERIPAEDLTHLSGRLDALGNLDGMVSLTHRMLDRRGLPIWVLHNFWSGSLNGVIAIQGCIVAVDCDALRASEQTVISRFVHKIGNQFQLINLLVNSLKRTLPESKETVMLEETVEKAIELTRNFSDYNQVPTCLSQIALMDILQAAIMTRKSLFDEKGITFDSQIPASVNGATLKADANMLEIAIGHVLQNALEATDAGGQVTFQVTVECFKNCGAVARISVIDSGCGIDESAMVSVLVPFFTLKKKHDGLGLSMASRYIEFHRGILRITSAQEKGTKVEIVLPIEVKE